MPVIKSECWSILMLRVFVLFTDIVRIIIHIISYAQKFTIFTVDGKARDILYAISIKTQHKKKSISKHYIYRSLRF